MINGIKINDYSKPANSFSNTFEGVIITLNDILININIGKNGICIRNHYGNSGISIINFNNIIESTVDNTGTTTPTMFHVLF